jgi:hypothetical protein
LIIEVKYIRILLSPNLMHLVVKGTKIVLYWCLDLICHNIGTQLKLNKYIFDISIPFCHHLYLSATLKQCFTEFANSIVNEWKRRNNSGIEIGKFKLVAQTRFLIKKCLYDTCLTKLKVKVSSPDHNIGAMGPY